MECTCSQDCKVAIKKQCIPCFKFHTETGFGWNTRTVIECIKNNQFEMFAHIMEKKRVQPEHPRIPNNIWKRNYSDYEIASYALEYRNFRWCPFISKAVEQSSNPKNISLFKLALEAGNEPACDIIFPKLKVRTTHTARKRDLIQFMECAVFSRSVRMIKWVESKINNGTDNNWPTEWKENGDRLLEVLMGNKKYPDTYIFSEIFNYVFNPTGSKAEIYDWDLAAYHILRYETRYGDTIAAMFRAFWEKGGREHSTSGWKSYCIRANKLEELNMIHEQNPQWHADFLHECNILPSRRVWARRQIKEWAMNHGARDLDIEMEQVRIQERQMNADPVVQNNEVSPLHKMMELLEKMKESKMGGYEEGLYLEACTVMQQLHRQIRV